MEFDNRYIFRIDALKPETLSIKALSHYLSNLSDILGHERNVHFDKVQSGSAELVWWADQGFESDVRKRIEKVEDFLHQSELQKPILELNKRLANDNAYGQIYAPGRKLIASFPGQNFPYFRDVPAFLQEDILQGRLIRIGGKDETIHAQLDMGGSVVSKISMSRELARELVKYFLGPTLRLNGRARWRRDFLGKWELLSFSVSSFEVLNDDNLQETLDSMEQILTKGLAEAPNPFIGYDEEEG